MYQSFKLFFDFLFALIGIIIIFPILIPIIVLLRVTGEGEIFYKQERLGRNNKKFGILKFATMLKNSPNIGNKTITLRNDPRITSLGKYLRITKLNELPQLFNIMKGEMSFVGPRPLLDTSFVKFSESVQEIIYLNKPGITGMGSVVFRDEEKLVSEVRKLNGDPMIYYRKYIYPYKGKLETYYFHNVSFITDLKILFATGWQILFKQSKVIYTFFPDLPKIPKSLTIKGVQETNTSL